jgi:hypothetical protein
MSLLELSAVELRRQMGEKEISPVELMQACITQINTYNPAVNAICGVGSDDVGSVTGVLADVSASPEPPPPHATRVIATTVAASLLINVICQVFFYLIIV